MLFSLEEACSVWSRRIAWRCFIASAVAVFTHAQLNPESQSHLLSAQLRPLAPLEWLQQLPALAAVSAGGGLLGAAFNKMRLVMRPLRAKPKHHAARIQEAVGVAAVTVTAVAALTATVGRWGRSMAERLPGMHALLPRCCALERIAQRQAGACA